MYLVLQLEVLLRTVIQERDVLHHIAADVHIRIAAVHVEVPDGMVYLPHPGVPYE